MSNRFQIKQKVSVKQVINLRQTIKMASLGTSAAVLICFLLFIGFNSQTSNVLAGNKSLKTDSSKFAIKRLFDVSDSILVKYQSKVESNDSIFNLKKEKSSLKKHKKPTELTESSTNDNQPKPDFISIYPKNTSGAFNIEFAMADENAAAPKIELIDKKGAVVDSKIATPENGKVLESFIMNSDLQNGPYLVRISMNKQLFIRQVVLQKNQM